MHIKTKNVYENKKTIWRQYLSLKTINYKYNKK
jgi:hypothetical protein